MVVRLGVVDEDVLQAQVGFVVSSIDHSRLHLWPHCYPSG